jgi:predicted dehydrogenase
MLIFVSGRVFIMEKQVRTAIIGIGSMGKRYAKMIDGGSIKNMQLTAVCARSDMSCDWVKENISQNVKVYRDVFSLFEHGGEFDAVIIVTPHKLHPKLTIDALNLGKHVMCDKPAGVSVTDAIRMQDTAKEKNLVYGLMFHNRTYPVIRELKARLDSGELGRLNRIMLENSIYYRTSFYHSSGSWRSSWQGEGGGALINQGQHILDYWQWLFGLPQSLYAQISFGKYNDFAVDDEAIITMKYPDNLTGTFILTTGEIQREERLSITGSKGKITMQGNTLTIERNAIDSMEYSRTAKINTRDEMATTTEKIICDSPQAPYECMLDNFVKAITKKEPLIADGLAGIRTLQLTNGAYLSAWENKSVTLPIDGGHFDVLLQEQVQKESQNVTI